MRIAVPIPSLIYSGEPLAVIDLISNMRYREEEVWTAGPFSTTCTYVRLEKTPHDPS
jgi:hypothetical protein